MNLKSSSDTIVIAALGLTLIVAQPTSVGRGSPSEVTFCGDLLPAALQQANASFEIFYDIETGGSGEAVRITKLKNDLLPEAPLLACLNKWKLPVTNGHVSVSMKWEHAKGWTEIGISMPGHPSRRITIDPGWPF
ncbi:MAG: hypothetical protein ABI665_25065 [Vicinamibacterales bacterium]